MKTAWIIGNAPSIAELDMTRLKDAVTFSFNRAYIAYPEWGWKPTYYMAIDMFVIRQSARDINSLIAAGKIGTSFFNLDACLHITPTPETHFLYMRDAWGFDPGRLAYCGDVAACSLQVAYLLGYRKINIIGVDLDWGEHGETGPDRDRDHFRLDYETHAVRMSPPGANGHKDSWRMTVEQAVKAPYNMQLTVGTPNSYLRNWLPYVPFEELVNA